MNIMFILDDNEHCTNIGIAKALTEAELSHNDLKEIVGYLSVFLYNHDPIKKGGAE